MKPFKPMLACPVDTDKLKFPCLASPKLDGVRAVVRGGRVMSRSNKLIPNMHVQAMFSHLEGYDGELIVGSPTASDVYNVTVSGVMRAVGLPAVAFYVFDHIEVPEDEYFMRIARINSVTTLPVIEHSQQWINTHAELSDYEDQALLAGYEGVILRSPGAAYKYGRGTMGDQCLMKLKRFEDAEAEIIGYEEQMHNGNAAFTNELGHTARSSHASGKVGDGVLGALVCRTPEGVVFNIGTGFDAKQREDFWAIRDKGLVGRIAKYKFFPVGVKEAPRHPVFLGFRAPEDM